MDSKNSGKSFRTRVMTVEKSFFLWTEKTLEIHFSYACVMTTDKPFFLWTRKIKYFPCARVLFYFIPRVCAYWSVSSSHARAYCSPISFLVYKLKVKYVQKGSFLWTPRTSKKHSFYGLKKFKLLYYIAV